jgi:hypothetical protein
MADACLTEHSPSGGSIGTGDGAGLDEDGRAAAGIRVARLVLLACILLVPAAARAQVPEFPDTLDRQWIVARAERYAATHTTSLGTDYHVQQDRVQGIVRTNLASTTTLLGSPSTKDQIDALIDFEYDLPSSLRLFFLTEGTLTNDLQRDARIPGLNNTAATFIGVGGRAVDRNGNRIGLAIGGAYNRQLNVEDAGGGIYTEANGRFDLAGYLLDIDGKGRWYNVAPRHNGNAYVSARIARRFEEGATATLETRYELINTDLYIKRSEDDVLQYGGLTYDGLTARREGRLAINSTLNYPMSDVMGFDLSFSLANQRIGQEELSEGLPPLPRDPEPYHYDRKEFSFGAAGRLSWTPPRLSAAVRLEYSTNEQYNTIDPIAPANAQELARRRASNAQNDFIAQQLLLAGSGEYRIARYDTLQMNASVAIYRYDTPSLTNYFDKDEQSIQGQIRYARSFSPMLDFAIYGQVFLTHLVYLLGQNSNDNNWNRVFRLAPSVDYRLGESFGNYLETEVLANYTQYDFEGRTQSIRGRSFRELHLRDSMSLAISGSLRLVGQGDLRISERGSFNWTEFAESPLERTRTEGLEAELVTGAVEGTLFGVGGRLSRVKNYRVDARTAALEPFSDRTSFGPTARFEARLSEWTEVIFSGWWEHRFEESRLVGRTPILFLTVGMKL